MWRATNKRKTEKKKKVKCHVSLFGPEFGPIRSRQAHDVNTTSPQRRCNVMTLHRRWGDVIFTSCARWDLIDGPHIIKKKKKKKKRKKKEKKSFSIFFVFK